MGGAGKGLRAFTRAVPDSIQHCELTHVERQPIDLGRARLQHAAYELALAEMGCIVQSVPAAHDMPDSVFIEDTAVVFDDIAVLARPAVASRQHESDAVAAVLTRCRRLAAICAPATLDGGDVMQVGHDVYVGVSGRTNAAGLRQLADIVGPFRYRVHPVETRGCLHLKSAVTCIGDDLLLVNPHWVNATQFVGMKAIAVDPDEPFGANVVRLGNVVLCAASAPKTATRLERFGLDVRAVDLSELAKAEGALTCCSLILRG
jgi:dimethylargininase